jgi:effector-binding domain-containing protein
MNKNVHMIKAANLFFIVVCIFILGACNKKNKNGEKKENDAAIVIKKDTVALKKGDPPVRPPIINIIDTIAVKYTVLYIKDSAASSQGISAKLANIYSVKLAELIKKQKLKITGPPIAWYKTNKPPFFFEAGLPVNKKPVNLPKGIFVKTIGGDSAVVAHFYGPYSLTTMGYDALADWVKDNKKKRNGMPYEIYITEPVSKDGKSIDPYKTQTDIVYPRN